MSSIAVDARRDWKVVGLVGTGHFFSHFYILTLPPLFPLLKVEFGVSYAALGLLLTVADLSSGAAQVPVGFLVDKVGARPVLFLGFGLLSASIALIAFTSTYWGVLALMALAGAGNSVFHPADYAIMSASVDKQRMGRAFGFHTFSGNLGWACAPLVIVLATGFWGWRTAIGVAGVTGLIVLGILILNRAAMGDHRVADDGAAEGDSASAAGGAEGVRLLMSKPILLLFAFFVATAMAMAAVYSFSVTTLVAMYGTSLTTANGALTGYLFATAVGILVGGFVADRTRRHEMVAAVAFFFSAVLTMWIATGSMPLVLLAAVLSASGFLQGMTRPSRDMLVRAVTPKGATGKVFAFVSTGLNVGAAIVPVVLGWIIDQGRPDWVFWLTAIFLWIAFATILWMRHLGFSAAVPETPAE